MELEGKVALVTGGARGIGAAVVEALAAAGADVAFTYRRSAERSEQLAGRVRAAGRRALPLRADAADADAVRDAVTRTADALGRLDVLVNNAGVFPSGPLPDGGRILSIGSCFVERVPYSGVTAYAMSKAGLIGLTRGLARDLAPQGITAVVVHPGSTDTDMNPVDAPEADAERELIALGRYARPEEIAAVVTLLAGPAGAYVTGTAIAVDGGFAA